jgi:hypothetical protein
VVVAAVEAVVAAVEAVVVVVVVVDAGIDGRKNKRINVNSRFQKETGVFFNND